MMRDSSAPDPRGIIVSVNTSLVKGVQKKPTDRILLVVGFGVEGDAHGGPWHRQVSLLAEESIRKMRDVGLELGPGDFAENLTTRGLDLLTLAIGTKVRVGAEAVLEITQHGKTCHTACAIRRLVDECIMPTEGIFGKVLQGGTVRPGDELVVLAEAKEGVGP